MAKSNEVIARLIEETKRGELEWTPRSPRREWVLDLKDCSFYVSHPDRALTILPRDEGGWHQAEADDDEIDDLVDVLMRSAPIPESPSEEEKWQLALNALKGTNGNR